MTREEALKILDTIPTIGEQVDALDVAINALEQEPCIQEKQANADKIDAVYIDGFKAGYSQARFDLEQEPSGDLISRQAVYHILDEVGGDFDKPREAVVPVDYIADMVGELPPVTPQSKVGHWIKENPPMVEQYPFCSECGFVNPFENALNYCPNCGARMVEPQESEDKE